MQYIFVGTHPESLASGRPLVFGDLVDADVLVEADKRLAPLLVEKPARSTPTLPAPAIATPVEA